MKIGSRSSVRDVAAVVGESLKKAAIDAVLTGGACATIYSEGEYQSTDLDFILLGDADRKQLDAAMAASGFRREGDRYVHPKTDFFVEFPKGPLSIGRDNSITPARIRTGRGSVKALSATDSCRDRLAAYYFWNDLSALAAAAAIARRRSVDLKKVRAWSKAEGEEERFEEFRSQLRSVKTPILRPRARVRKG